MNLIELTDATKTYAGGTARQPVLCGINLSLTAGDTVAITGPSGSGKSTLLNLMGALDAPTTGTVRVEGRDLGTLNAAELAALRRRTLGFVFQLHHLLPQCTVMENILVPTLIAPGGGEADSAIRERARHLLERTGLWDLRDRRPGRLSGGERQRAAVARALINRPRVLLADEPTGSLDHDTARQLIELLLHANREEGAAIVLVTHAPALAEAMARKYELRQGRLEPRP
jgi:lipoprotein-releasing system ATP-binding protein